jgi:hypothetical protein
MLIYFAPSGLLNQGHHNNHIKISGSDKQMLTCHPLLLPYFLPAAVDVPMAWDFL